MSYFFEFLLEKTNKNKRRKKKRNPPFFFNAGITTIRKNLKRYSLKAAFYMEKQKLKKFYGNLSEHEFKQLANFISYKKGRRQQGYRFILGLERRLDALYYRFYLARNIKEARTVVLEGKILINGKAIIDYKHMIKKHDMITFAKPYEMIEIWRERMESKTLLGLQLGPFPDPFLISFKHLLFKYNVFNLPKYQIYLPYRGNLYKTIETYY